MIALFCRFRISHLMQLVSAISFLLFLSVIAFNYHSIGAVQKLNTSLMSGPIAAKERWHEIDNLVADAEKVRLEYLVERNSDTADRMLPLLGKLNEVIAKLDPSQTETLKQVVQAYEQGFKDLVAAMVASHSDKIQLAKDREGIETWIYEGDNSRLEVVLSELLVAEMATFAEEKNLERVKTVRVILDRFARDVAGKKGADVFNKALSAYSKTFESFLTDRSTVQERSKLMIEQVRSIISLVQQTVIKADQEAGLAVTLAKAKADNAQNQALIWTTLGVVVAVILSVLFERALTSRINYVLLGLDALAKGDLRFRFTAGENSRNEISHVMMNTNRMADNLSSLLVLVLEKVNAIERIARHFAELKVGLLESAEQGDVMISAVTQQNDGVDENTRLVYNLSENNEEQAVSSEQSARNFLGIIRNIAENAEHASDNVNTMAAASEEMTANVTEVKSNLERVDGSIKTVASAVEMLDSSLEEVRRQCQNADEEAQRANQHVEESAATMRKLEHTSSEISKVVEMIDQIADQTNMLALNASIEAAGAGTAGRGFSVVANEVKELARETSSATRLISDLIMDIQAVAKEVSSSMERVGHSIVTVVRVNGDIVRAVNEQSRSTGEIASSMEQVTQATEVVTLNASELEHAAQEVAQAASRAAKGTRDIVDAVTTAVENANQIAENANHTRNRSSEIKEKTKSVFSVSGDVQKSGLIMYDLMQRLQKLAGVMAAETNNLQEGAEALEASTKSFIIQ